MKTLLRALAFAADKGCDLARPVALANLLANEGGVEDERVIVSAVLHGALAGREMPPRELERLFGQEARDIVLALAPVPEGADAGRQAPEPEVLAGLSRRARLVLLADRICRLRELVAQPRKLWPLEERQAAFDTARQVVDGLHGVHPQLERLFDDVCKLRPKAPEGLREVA